MSKQAAERDTVERGLRRRWLLGRLAWLVVAFLSVAICAAGLLIVYVDHQAVAAALEAPELASRAFVRYYIAINAVFAAVCVALAGVIFWRGSNDWMALFTALMLVTFGTVSHNAALPDTVAATYPTLRILIQSIEFLSNASLIGWCYLFPNGAFVPRWTRWLVLAHLIWSMLPDEFFGTERLDSALYLLVGLPVYTVLFGSIVVAQVYRYRYVYNGLQRQQTKWVLFGLAALVVGLLAAISLDVLLAETQATLLSQYGPITVVYGFTLLLPLSIGVAILRYRLYDIDIIINRTLVYAVLTLTLGLVYVGCILLSRTLVAPLTGSSELAIMASTLAIAALFTPLRQRIQNIIDRRFYRRKYDAAKVLAAFATTARDETDLDKLTDELLRVVDETMQPEFVGLWLKPVDGAKRET